MSSPGRLVETSAGRIYVSRGGAGPKVVLVHGFIASHYTFASIRAQLEASFEVITIDLPAHGESDRPSPDRFAYDLPAFASSVAETMRLVGVERAHVIGHSMGGGTALTLASRFPELVDRLVLEDPAIYPLPLPFIGKLGLLPIVGELLVTRVYSRRDLKNYLATGYRDPKLCTEEMVDYYWERFNRAGTRLAMHAIMKKLAALVDDTGDPGRVLAPTQIVWGEEDSNTPLAHGKRLVKQIPGAVLSVVPASGHSPHEERAGEFLRAVVPFLQSTAATARVASS